MKRSIYEWAQSIDKEINYLRESQEKAYSTLRLTNQKCNARLLGKDQARYYSEELDTLLNRTTSYYNHLIADLHRQKELALLKNANRKGSQDTYNLYAELIKEFKGLKRFACNDLRDFIITIVPGWVAPIDVCVTEENLQRHVHRIEKRGIGMTVVRKDGKLYVYHKLNWK